jgi:5-formyltetrahydrofolate cyclo-ligase
MQMDEKDQLRRAMVAARKQHFAKKGADDAAALAHGAARLADKLKGKRVAAYLPMGSELDPLPLLEGLRKNGKEICLPVCVDEDAPLIFRRYKKNTGFLPDVMGIAAPNAAAQTVTPEIVLLPLLAFDKNGNRLGRGAGFYDRTLAKLREAGTCRFIGLAFDMQMVDKCPVAPHDEALHNVLTPSQWHDFGTV